jgi:Rieske Fe-S protein
MLTTKRTIGMVLVAAAATALMASVVLAEANVPAKAPPKPLAKIEGAVSVVKDANEIKEVKVTTKDKGVFNVVLNEKGKALGTRMAGKEAVVHGTVSEKNGEKWIDVHAFNPPRPAMPKSPEKPKY